MPSKPKKDATDPTWERIEGPTPNGGAYSVAYYKDKDFRPCPKSQAVRVKIHEMSAEGESLVRTYGTLNGFKPRTFEERLREAMQEARATRRRTR